MISTKKSSQKKLEYERAYRKRNRELLNSYYSNYRLDNSDLLNEQARIRYKKSNNRKVKQKQWRLKNLEKDNKKRSMLKKEKLRDPFYRMIHNLRNRTWIAVKKGKAGSTIKDLGCSVEELKIYLECKFLPGMTWENYGKQWQIDHIIPLYKFDLTNIEQFKKAAHYTNLQPLWNVDHYMKTAVDIYG